MQFVWLLTLNVSRRPLYPITESAAAHAAADFLFAPDFALISSFAKCTPWSAFERAGTGSREESTSRQEILEYFRFGLKRRDAMSTPLPLTAIAMVRA